MSFTDNTRDEVTLIRMKHEYHENLAIIADETSATLDVREAESDNRVILKTFAEVQRRNAQGKQAGSYEAVAEQCEEFFKSIAAEPAMVG